MCNTRTQPAGLQSAVRLTICHAINTTENKRTSVLQNCMCSKQFTAPHHNLQSLCYLETARISQLELNCQ